MQDLTPRAWPSAARLREQLSGVGAAEGRVYQLHWVERRECVAGSPERRGYLDEAAGVGGRIGVGPDGEDALGLATSQLERCLRLHEIVDPGAPTAERLIFGLREVETGNSR